MAALTGLGEIPGLYDGKQLTEAFEPGALGGSEAFCAGIEPPHSRAAVVEGPAASYPAGARARAPGLPLTQGDALTTLKASTRTASYKRPFVLSGRVSASDCSRPDWVEVRRRAWRASAASSSGQDSPGRLGSLEGLDLGAARNASYMAIPAQPGCGIRTSSPCRYASAPRGQANEAPLVRAGRCRPRRGPAAKRRHAGVAPATDRVAVADRGERPPRPPLALRAHAAELQLGDHQVLWPRRADQHARASGFGDEPAGTDQVSEQPRAIALVMAVTGLSPTPERRSRKPALTIAVDPVVLSGGDTTYRIVVTNHGGATTNWVEVTNHLPGEHYVQDQCASAVARRSRRAAFLQLQQCCEHRLQVGDREPGSRSISGDQRRIRPSPMAVTRSRRWLSGAGA